jgi:hypothetical protein
MITGRKFERMAGRLIEGLFRDFSFSAEIIMQYNIV